MRNLALFICCIEIMLCSSCARTNDGSARLDRPVWHVGDSWQVRAPVNALRDLLSGNRTEFIERSEYYTAQCKVTGVETLKGEKCFVLAVKAIGAYPRSDITKSTCELRGYYRMSDLALRMVKTLRWENGARSPEWDSTDVPGVAEHVCGTNQSLTFFPIELPSFPIHVGKQQTYYRSDHRRLDGHGGVDYSPKGIEFIERMTAMAEAIRARENKRSSCEVTVIFRHSTEMAGRTRTNTHFTQVWEPGKPWWTSMRDQRGFKFTLVEDSISVRPAWLTPMEVAGGVCCMVGLFALWRRGGRGRPRSHGAD